MPKCLLKKVLPFALMFLVGAALGSLPNFFAARRAKHDVAAFQRAHHEGERGERKKSCRQKRSYMRNSGAQQAHGSTRVLTTEMSADDRRIYSESWTPATILVTPNPLYTEEARVAGIEGIVRTRVTFGADGRVSDVETLSAELQHGLTEEAVRAVKQIRFTPATLDRRPVVSQGVVESVFHLTRTKECLHER